jgi:arsenate reductase (thioredoxin)
LQNAAKWQRLFSENMLDNYEAISAGTHHISQINPLVVQAMNQVGIDISNQKPKEMTKDMIINAKKIINMGCMDKNFCLTVFIHIVVD